MLEKNFVYKKASHKKILFVKILIISIKVIFFSLFFITGFFEINHHEVKEYQSDQRVIETLQLFPLNSFDETDHQQEKLRFHASECRETSTFPYTMISTPEMDHPPLDLRLSFL